MGGTRRGTGKEGVEEEWRTAEGKKKGEEGKRTFENP